MQLLNLPTALLQDAAQHTQHSAYMLFVIGDEVQPSFRANGVCARRANDVAIQRLSLVKSAAADSGSHSHLQTAVVFHKDATQVDVATGLMHAALPLKMAAWPGYKRLVDEHAVDALRMSLRASGWDVDKVLLLEDRGRRAWWAKHLS